MLNNFFYVTFFALTVGVLNAQAQVSNDRNLPQLTIPGGVLNSKARSLPKPELPDTNVSVGASGEIRVEVIVDEQGDVISAKAVSGPLPFRKVSEQSARQAKFNRTTLSGVPVKVKGIIIYRFTTNDRELELVDASKAGNLVKVRTLVVRGADVNTKDVGGATPLMFAATNNHLPVVKYLIAKGADVNAKNDKNGWTALMYAESLSVTRILIAGGAEVNAKDNDGKTALHVQVIKSQRQLPIVKTLLAGGADVNARDRLGMPPLMWAARNGDLQIAQALVDKGANINARNDAGWTALITATWHNRQPVVELLVAKGADTTILTAQGMTALDIAKLKRYVGILAILSRAR